MAPVTRRTFLKDLGQGTMAVAVLGLTVVACSSDGDGTASSANETTTPTTGGAVTTSTTQEPTSTTGGSGDGEASGAVVWERVVLGSVSAYLLVRRGEVAIVDAGNPGNEDEIAASLAAIGNGWDDVSHVILTHLHGDHVGSLGPVMTAAPAAIGYAGAPDIPSIPSPRPLTAVGDGDTVFGLEIIATPGHTAGSISVLDPVGGLLVTGDALRGEDGGVIGPSPRFTDDMDEANQSISKLAGFGFDTVVFGHGDPVVGEAARQVTALAAALG